MKNAGILIILAVLLFSSCEKDGRTELEKLKVNRSKWNSKNIQNYTMDESISCFCAVTGVHHVAVSSDKTILAVKNGKAVEQPEEYFLTVNQLFDYIESSLARNPDRAEIKYDVVYGFPSSVYFDFSERMADEEMGYAIENFKPLLN